MSTFLKAFGPDFSWLDLLLRLAIPGVVVLFIVTEVL
jgi:hypothetical protein